MKMRWKFASIVLVGFENLFNILRKKIIDGDKKFVTKILWRKFVT